ncbi:lactose/L-arabinose transport system permease protein/arabinosaccharide transport system permease protein [Actinopolymorpha cephalotaxi]|uniref:ABC-type sugar transport system permease subunit n=1 Tax=Actinopolymorpha cephalotaxi TaxID=504797 RepID=A0A1I2LFB1_9ACTN|nr:sugar ABC transporter permease [Actinopolymorpha cephalotaxi]NYH84946.1 ABC-type sugar transport system permease subunit [Actinopolymorpha cephalotaxi]SFF77170.1 lactose/L-arabinose transport system permease protein/arabinosaccharide transport system permease protein [Actinopolymorpha cephalotaxi]
MATSTLGARLSAPLEPARTWWWQRQRKVSPYLFIAPFFLLFLVFGLYPIIYSFILSFTKGFGFENRTFVGLGNYIHLMSDPRFLMALRNTTIYALGSVVLIGGLSLLIALAINSKSVKWKTFYRTAFFFPVLTSEVVITVIAARILDEQFGLLNAALGWFGVGPFAWLTDPKLVMFAIVLIGVWTWTGINALYWMAGLNGIDEDFYEAAAIDGASSWQAFRHITMPLLRPIALFVVLQAIIGSYNLFALPFLLTNGGPSDASLTVTLYIYNQGFQFFNVGYASAIAYVMTFFLLIVSLVNIKVFRGRSAPGE